MGKSLFDPLSMDTIIPLLPSIPSPLDFVVVEMRENIGGLGPDKMGPYGLFITREIDDQLKDIPSSTKKCYDIVPSGQWLDWEDDREIIGDDVVMTGMECRP